MEYLKDILTHNMLHSFERSEEIHEFHYEGAKKMGSCQKDSLYSDQLFM